MATKKTELFLVGISAGAIAAIFPRLMGAITGGASSMGLFPNEFLVAAALFALMIGVSMIWFYMDTDESPRNLFLAALALPAVLSGGINMSNVSAAAEDKIGKLNQQSSDLQRALEQQAEIPTGLDGIDAIDPSLLGRQSSLQYDGRSWWIREAMAAEGNAAGVASSPDATEDDEMSGVDIPAQTLDRLFVVVLQVGGSKADLLTTAGRVSGETRMIQQGGQYLLIRPTPVTKADALIDAVTLKRKYNLEPRLIKVKR